MKIFDSLKNKRWSGKGFDLKQNSLLVLKSANFFHLADLKPGKYKIKIVGKKRTGSGKINLEVGNDDSEIFFKNEINFNNSNWTELTFEFEIKKYLGQSKIRIYRDKDVYGSVEIGRIFFDLILENQPDYSGSRFSIKNVQKKKLEKNQGWISELFQFQQKKIAFIIPYGIYGGAEVYLQNLIQEFDSTYQISLIYLKGNLLQNHLTGSNIIHRTVKNLDYLRGVLKSVNYDFVVYYNRLDVYQTLIDMKENNELNSKLIEIYHSDFLWAGSLSGYKKRSPIEKMIVVSKSLGLDIEGISDNNREVIPVGIDLNKFSAGQNDKLRKQVGSAGYLGVIGTVARLSKEKRIDRILDLAEVMSDYLFVVVGSGPEEGNLRKIIEEKNIRNVNLVGQQSNVAEYYKVFDAFILMSKIEGTPISILEAMASGIPVFSNFAGAISDILKDKITGFKLTEDPKENAEIIKENIYNFGVIESARNYVEENHDIKKNVKQFINSLFSGRNFFVQKEEEVRILPGQYI